MSEQTTMTGQARLKFIAGNARIQGYKWLSDDLDELAALWEAALEQAGLDYALLADDYKQLGGDIDELRAALERARAVERQLRIASDDPRASYETSRAYERAANDLAAALAEGGRP